MWVMQKKNIENGYSIDTIFTPQEYKFYSVCWRLYRWCGVVLFWGFCTVRYGWEARKKNYCSVFWVLIWKKLVLYTFDVFLFFFFAKKKKINKLRMLLSSTVNLLSYYSMMMNIQFFTLFFQSLVLFMKSREIWIIFFKRYFYVSTVCSVLWNEEKVAVGCCWMRNKNLIRIFFIMCRNIS